MAVNVLSSLRNKRQRIQEQALGAALNPFDQGGSLLGLYHFFYKNKNRFGAQALMPFPDTIVYEHHFPTGWYSYTPGGPGYVPTITRRSGKACDSQAIWRRFTRAKADDELVATFVSASDDALYDYNIKFLEKEALMDFLINPAHKGILQKYIPSSTQREGGLYCVWTPFVNVVERWENENLLGDTRLSLYERCTTQPGCPHAKMAACSTDVVKRVRAMCDSLVNDVVKFERRTVTSMTLYFKMDADSSLWLLFASNVSMKKISPGKFTAMTDENMVVNDPYTLKHLKLTRLKNAPKGMRLTAQQKRLATANKNGDEGKPEASDVRQSGRWNLIANVLLAGSSSERHSDSSPTYNSPGTASPAAPFSPVSIPETVHDDETGDSDSFSQPVASLSEYVALDRKKSKAKLLVSSDKPAKQAAEPVVVRRRTYSESSDELVSLDSDVEGFEAGSLASDELTPRSQATESGSDQSVSAVAAVQLAASLTPEDDETSPKYISPTIRRLLTKRLLTISDDILAIPPSPSVGSPAVDTPSATNPFDFSYGTNSSFGRAPSLHDIHTPLSPSALSAFTFGNKSFNLDPDANAVQDWRKMSIMSAASDASFTGTAMPEIGRSVSLAPATFAAHQAALAANNATPPKKKTRRISKTFVNTDAPVKANDAPVIDAATASNVSPPSSPSPSPHPDSRTKQESPPSAVPSSQVSGGSPIPGPGILRRKSTQLSLRAPSLAAINRAPSTLHLASQQDKLDTDVQELANKLGVSLSVSQSATPSNQYDDEFDPTNPFFTDLSDREYDGILFKSSYAWQSIYEMQHPLVDSPVFHEYEEAQALFEEAKDFMSDLCYKAYTHSQLTNAPFRFSIPLNYTDHREWKDICAQLNVKLLSDHTYMLHKPPIQMGVHARAAFTTTIQQLTQSLQALLEEKVTEALKATQRSLLEEFHVDKEMKLPNAQSFHVNARRGTAWQFNSSVNKSRSRSLWSPT